MAQNLGGMTNILCRVVAWAWLWLLFSWHHCHWRTSSNSFCGTSQGFRRSSALEIVFEASCRHFLPMIQSCHLPQGHKTSWQSRPCSVLSSSVTPGRSRSQHCSSIACLRLVSYKRCHAKNIFLDFLRLPLNALAIVNWENSLLILKCLFYTFNFLRYKKSNLTLTSDVPW